MSRIKKKFKETTDKKTTNERKNISVIHIANLKKKCLSFAV